MSLSPVRDSRDTRELSRGLSRGERNAVAVRISQKVAIGVVFVAAMFMSIMDVSYTRVNIRDIPLTSPDAELSRHRAAIVALEPVERVKQLRQPVVRTDDPAVSSRDPQQRAGTGRADIDLGMGGPVIGQAGHIIAGQAGMIVHNAS